MDISTADKPMQSALDFYALNELRTIALFATGGSYIYRDARVIGVRLLAGLVDAGYIERAGDDWSKDCYRATEAGRAIAAEAAAD